MGKARIGWKPWSSLDAGSEERKPVAPTSQARSTGAPDP